MTAQLALDLAPPRSRRRDPATSRAAADRAATFAGEHHRRILAALAVGPMTPREIAAATGLDYVAVQRRGRELEDAGLIVRGPGVRDGQRIWAKR